MTILNDGKQTRTKKNNISTIKLLSMNSKIYEIVIYREIEKKKYFHIPLKIN